jgi:hypothetical protein
MIRINVDPTNPGQFFACCGLLELADRIWPGAVAWFGAGCFHINCEGTLRELLTILILDPPEAISKLENGLEVKPLIALLRFSFDGGASHSITLDGWTRIRSDGNEAAVIGNSPWNFWSGQQTSLGIWLALRTELCLQLGTLTSNAVEDLFNQRVFLSGRFGFDPGAAWNALDVGFSPNVQGLDVKSSAAVELLAAFGLQRFRPAISRDRESFEYATWGTPLPPSIAFAAMSGDIQIPPSIRFRGHFVSRGQYGALGLSFPLPKGVSDE